MVRTVKGGTDARRERWKGHREARRAEFVEATIRAVARHGADVGMDEIAGEAGVSKPVLYRHFADKADLYLAVGRRATELLMDRLGPAIEGDGSLRARITRIVDAYLSVIEEHPHLYRFVVRAAFAERPVEQDVVGEDKAMIATALTRLFGDFLRANGMDSGGAEPWAHALVGMVQNAGDWWLDRQSMSRASLGDYLSTIIWHALDGLLRSAGVVLDPDEPIEARVSGASGQAGRAGAGQAPVGSGRAGAAQGGAAQAGQAQAGLRLVGEQP
ncbi:TetR/AcrR family transcriptional regulator [Actinosynnema pretiosum]|uniref:TetR family transcriptional regulator n=1 Tax=Actinosynnema pretiosum TaxID=42197 RepID=A0A290Z0P6_9PSEU|nr:TetR/AcrR family transcriptional regulator [Actinosynnema pretiosum]ATE52567.1 TetR family transcriptional regulator [Actinosynnema pretiosum]